jgi:hypothetical protein
VRTLLVFASWLFVAAVSTAVSAAGEKVPTPIAVEWKDNYLIVRGEDLAGGELRTNYLEAFCRPGSTDRPWGATVIPHKTRKISTSKNGREIHLESVLADGVVVTHRITVGDDEIDFRLVAKNPTKKDSLAHWAQPCSRVDKFTGADPKNARVLYPDYIKKCFLFTDGRLTRLPTRPWATKARYTPGQVYCPRGVDRNDVNPRPLSTIVPSSGLTGCYSSDEKQIFATAWEPYQEIFQGVITCIHSDFRIGGLKAGQQKNIRGKMYFVPANAKKLVARYEKDFPEHTAKAK